MATMVNKNQAGTYILLNRPPNKYLSTLKEIKNHHQKEKNQQHYGGMWKQNKNRLTL